MTTIAKDERGAVLLLTVLTLAIVLVSALGVAGVVQRSLRVTRTVEKGLRSYLVAEAGIEDGLYHLLINPSGQGLVADHLTLTLDDGEQALRTVTDGAANRVLTSTAVVQTAERSFTLTLPPAK